MTCTPTSSPTRRAAAAPASVAALTDATSPRTIERDQARIDFLPAHEHDVGSFHHGVGSLDHADKSASFHEAKGFAELRFGGIRWFGPIGAHREVALMLPRLTAAALSAADSASVLRQD